MKLKKIKNYILTFIICLLGAFTFNSIETKAYNITGTFSVNENVVYSTEDDTRHIYLYGDPDDKSKMSLLYYNSTNGSYIFYFQCSYNVLSPFSITCNGQRALGDFGYTTNVANNTLNLYLTPETDVTYNRIRAVWSADEEYEFIEVDSYNLGYGIGYQVGYDSGYDVGYDIGYDGGVQNQNTLVGMVGAIFTGPVSMFQEIFNFNVLGINFAEMLLGLVTLLVVIWLIKKFI